jgi:hypothetical protein
MHVELFSICDAVQDYGGKLVVIGTYDTILAREVPTTHPVLSIAARIRFKNSEAGNYRIKINILDANGRTHLAGPEGEITIGPTERPTSVVNFAVNLMNIQITSYNAYVVQLLLNDLEASQVPLYIGAP